MHKLRSSILATLSLAALAACGDKITLVDPPAPAAPALRSITLTASDKALTVGQTFQFGANVVADPGFAGSTAVTWTSSNQSAATVSGTGLVTAVAAGSTLITATTTDPNIKATATVTVTAVTTPPIILATIALSQITQGVGNQCSGVAIDQNIDLQNACGQVNVTVSYDPGTQRPSQIDLILRPTGTTGASDVVCDSRSIGNATPNVGENAADLDVINVVMNCNTAAFNVPGQTAVVAGQPNGTVRFRNGSYQLIARLTVAGQTPGSGTSTTAATTTITLNNTDNFYVGAGNNIITNTPSAGQIASALAANGLQWRAGSVTIGVTPVIYTAGRSLTSATVNLINAGGDVALGTNGAIVAGGGTIASKTTAAGGAFPATVVFTNDNLANGLINATVDTLVAQIVSVDNFGNQGPSLSATGAPITASVAAGNFIRLDNRGPEGVTFTLAGTGTGATTTATAGVFNWVNGSYTLASGIAVGVDVGVGLVNGATAAAAAGTFAAGSAPTPLGAVTVAVGAANAAATTGYTALAAANTSVTTAGALLAASNTNIEYSATATAKDLLGNTTTGTLSPNVANPVTVTVGTSTRASFGVDVAAPSIRYADAAGVGTGPGSPGAAANVLARTAADSAFKTVGLLNYTVDYLDDRAGFVGSGATSNGFAVPGGTPMTQSLQRLFAVTPRQGSTATANCVTGFGTGTGCTTMVGVAYGSVLSDNWVRSPAVSLGGGTTVGYYVYQAQVRDMAGNLSATVKKQSALDPALPAITGFLVPQTIAGGSAATFVPTADDDLEVINGQIGIHYPNTAFGPNGISLVYPFGTLNAVGVRFDGPSPNYTTIAALATALTTPVQASLTVPNFIDQLEVVGTTGTNDGPVNQAAASRPATAVANLSDVVGDSALVTTGGNSGAGIATPTGVSGFRQAILASAFTQAAESWATIGGSNAVNHFRILASSRTTVTIEIEGPTGQALMPFSDIHLYRENSAGGAEASVYVRIPGTFTFSGTDNGTRRIWTVSFTPTTTFAIAAAGSTIPLRAVGIGSPSTTTPMLGNGLASRMALFSACTPGTTAAALGALCTTVTYFP